jgi:Putative Flp pilus-assembly TadE/G-like
MTRRTAIQRGGENGQVVVFVSVSLLALLGIGALSIDAAYMYDKRNKLYAAADAAAKSAAFAYKKDTSSDLWTFGQHEVAILGLTPVNPCDATSGTALCVNRPPTAGPYAGNPNFVEAIVSAPSTATFFGRVLGWMTGNPGARAVAGTVNPADCVIIKEDLEIGNFEFHLDGCSLSVGGELACTNPTSTVQGSPTPSVNVTGASSDCNPDPYMPGLNDNTGVAPIDPLAGKLPAVSWPDATLFPGSTTCIAGTTPVLTPGCYNNISPAVTTLLPGNYYMTGTVNIDHLSGDDVFLYLTNECTDPSCGPGGRFNVIDMNKTLHLTAHTAGPYTGIAVWQHASDTNPFSCITCPGGNTPNSFRLEWSGALYMPGVDQEFKNHVEFVPLNGCALYITRNLTVKNGNGSMTNTNCAALFGGAAFLSIAVTE